MKLLGEGQYNLNSMKEIFVTESFLELDRSTRKCQYIETYDNCKTRLHLENLRQKCGCLPLSLKLSEEVRTESMLSISIRFCLIKDALCMSDKEIECSQTITTQNNTSCLR